MTDTTSAPPADPGPPPTAPPGAPTGSDRFFSWVQGLGMVRGDAWLGGVCGGIAARLRIDPLIVRGIFVVVALLGFPALLVYAIAWALLPDTDGRIHFRELMHGRYDAAMTGVFILAIVGFVPVVPWLRNVLLWPLWALTGFAPWAWDDGSGVSALGVLGFVLALAVIGGLVYLIVRSARSDRPSRADAQTASAQPAHTVASDSGDDATAPLAATASIADSAGRAPAGSAMGSEDAVPLPAAPYGDDAAVADWRARQEAWRVQNDAWRRSQQDAARAARDQARLERHAHGAAFALEAEERRRVRRATRPRTSFVFVLTALGAAVVLGAVSVLTSLGDAATAPFAGAIGFFTAALVTALAMVVAGIIRRRSGFLTAVTIVLLVIGGSVAVASGPDRLTLGDVSLGTSTVEQRLTQPFGATFLSVGSLSDTEDVTAGGVVVSKGVGWTYIEVYPGTALNLDATLGDGTVSVERVSWRGDGPIESNVVRPDGDDTVQWNVANPNTGTDALTTQHITLDQQSGSVKITVYEK
ncbi:PspC domain-containing protein [Microbacterium jejuense]|uniref:PspC domain-containing protein n=1 Tax=Microbacterium jejuense TaxID=1263637 RepID=A0ABS7HMU7_9MICO|nr:PspC domain-containing protein [Microbacterium jejuense]MBW9094292.1 PspC domain-containing protein [Microbacterium jejuense]